MNITISLGWWLIPAAITALAFAKASLYVAKRKPGGDYDFGVDILFMGAAALIVSMAAWLAYFGLKLLFA